MEVKDYKLKIIFSTDGKHTVMVGTDELTKEEVEKSYKLAGYFYKKMLKEFGEGTRVIKEKEAAKKNGGNMPNCPKCGSPMVLREGKWGEFWGCSDYPACDGIVNTKEVSK